MKNTDYFCLKCLATGDSEAFVALYGRYHRTIYFSALKMTCSEEDAKDVTQTVFMKVWEHREQIDPSADFAAYIGTICRNIIFDKFKKKAREEEMKKEMELISNEESDADETDFRETYHRLLHEAIAQLPPQRRAVYEACKLKGQSYDRVASRNGIAISTVHDHIVKANKSIRDYLQTKGDVFIAILAGLILS